MTERDELQQSVRPYRQYRRGPGAIAIAVDKFKPLNSNPKVTLDAVGALARKHGLSCTALQLEQLTEGISIIGATVPIAYAFPDDLVKDYNAFVDAVRRVARDGPRFRDVLEIRSHDDKHLSNAFSGLAAASDNALEHLPKLTHPTIFWHDDVEYLRWCIRSARTRARTSPSFTKPGSPAVRLIHDALELAELWDPRVEMRIMPTCSQIAEALKKMIKAEGAA